MIPIAEHPEDDQDVDKTWTTTLDGTPMQYTAKDLEAMPTITETQTSELKIDTGDERVWLEKTRVEDGEPYDNKVTVEWLRDGKWTTVDMYAG